MMNRFKTNSTYTAILIFCCLPFMAASGQNTTPAKPNVLIIMVDDLNDCIERMGGHAQALTPNMTRLAKSGASFQSAYTNAPMCGPSRASMFTGVYPHHSNNYFQAPWFHNEVLSNTRTMMEQFKAAGYQVMGTGKIMHHNKKELWSHFENPADYSPTPFTGEERLPHPDVPASLECLRKEGLALVALTNSPPEVATAQLTNAGLKPAFDHILSVHTARHLKPHPAVYHQAAEEIGVPHERMMMVAAHDWDIAGAMAVGMAGGYVTRPGMAVNPLFAEPTLVAPTMDAMAEKIVRLRARQT